MTFSTLLNTKSLLSSLKAASESAIPKRECYLRLALVSALSIVYIQLFLILYPQRGPGVGSLVMVPVLAAAALFGLRGALVGWAGSTVLNTILLNIAAPTDSAFFGLDAIIIRRGGMPTLMLLLFA